VPNKRVRDYSWRSHICFIILRLRIGFFGGERAKVSCCGYFFKSPLPEVRMKFKLPVNKAFIIAS